MEPVARPVVTTLQRRDGFFTPESFLAQYRAGRFPYAGRWGRIVWKDPEQRAIVPVDERLHIPRSVAKLLRRESFEIRYDTAFGEVVRHCATVQGRAVHWTPWLTPEVQRVFLRLHELGYAHSTEAWRDGRLVGGEFGVTMNGLYCGESTFHLEPNAGKVALAHLAQRLTSRGYLLHDTQVLSSVSQQFGAYTIPREEYHERLRDALAADVTFV
ncbi:leucyl/phenylalanyl-tRNA--protein transferase [Pseudonocardia sp. H11422]|uniref:leucyl/phenylalanyl-tRNA--protein transferase n=1 Tax=Pseudonocardia sp. H11422 TaxID=2835866 RepID=UPI001BDD5928|nr:leucyl/phenylalanyl-tRNA--protein transferase [Pseudonocardia sp. H11422]